MKKLKYICEGEPLGLSQYVSNFRFKYKDWKFYNDRGHLCIKLQNDNYPYSLDIFEINKKVLTNNKLNRKLYEGKYVIREGYLTVDMDEV